MKRKKTNFLKTITTYFIIPNKKEKIPLKTIFISLSILVILHLLTHILNLTMQPLFGDEAIYIRWAYIIQEAPKEWLFVPHTDGKQPLFMWLNAFLTIPLFDDPVFAGRLVSVVSSLLTLLAIFLISFFLFSFSSAVFASLFYIFSPYHLFYSRMAFVDTLLGTFAIYTMLFILLLMQKRNVIWALGIGICIGCAFLTKSPGAILFLPAALSLFIFKQKRSILYLLFAFIIGASLIFINFCSPQKPIITEADPIFHHKSFFIFSQISKPLNILKIWIKNIISLFYCIHFSFPYLFGFFILFFIYRLFRYFSYKDVFIAIFSLLPMVIIVGIGAHPFYNYYLFTFLPFFISIGNFVSSFKWQRIISFFLIAPTFYFNIPILFSFKDAPLPPQLKELQNPGSYSGFGSREALEFLKENVGDNAVLLLSVDWGSPSDFIFLYLKDDKRFTIYETWWWPNKIQQLIPKARSVEMALSKYQQKKVAPLYPEKLKEREVWFVVGSSYVSPSFVLAHNPEFTLVRSFYAVDIYRKPPNK